MAELDRRVSLLLSALTERGFGWLAAEVIELIERGKGAIEDKDYDVAQQRRQLEIAILEKTRERITLEHSLDDAEEIRQFSGDEQVDLAVRIVIERLYDAVSMLSKSEDNLNGALDARVSIQFRLQDSVTTLNVQKASTAVASLREQKDSIVAWLSNQ